MLPEVHTPPRKSVVPPAARAPEYPSARGRPGRAREGPGRARARRRTEWSRRSTSSTTRAREIGKLKLEAGEAEQLGARRRGAQGAPGGRAQRSARCRAGNFFWTCARTLNKKDKEILSLKEQLSKKDKEIVGSQDRALVARARQGRPRRATAWPRAARSTRPRRRPRPSRRSGISRKKASEDFKGAAREGQRGDRRRQGSAARGTFERSSPPVRADVDQTLANERAAHGAPPLDEVEERRRGRPRAGKPRARGRAGRGARAGGPGAARDARKNTRPTSKREHDRKARRAAAHASRGAGSGEDRGIAGPRRGRASPGRRTGRRGADRRREARAGRPRGAARRVHGEGGGGGERARWRASPRSKRSRRAR